MTQILPISTLSNHRSLLSLHQIGGSGLLLNAASQQLFSLDARTAWLWCCIEDGCDDDEIVGLYAEDFGVSRREAGDTVEALATELGNVLHPSLAAQPGTAPARRDTFAGPRPTAESHLEIELLDTVFDVAFPTQTLCERARTVLGHLACEGRPADVDVMVVEKGEGFDIVVAGEIVERSTALLEVASQLKAALCHHAINRQPFDACIHAALVEMPGGRVLLPADSGSGKSCLALTLAGAGGTCLSDDLTLLALDRHLLRGVPAASCVKADAWETIAAIHPALRAAPAHMRVDGKLVKYLPIARKRNEAEPAALMVFPTFRKGLETRLTPLPPDDVLRRLLASVLAWRAELSPERLDSMIAWIEATPAYALTYGSSQDAVAVIETIFKGTNAAAQPCPM